MFLVGTAMSYVAMATQSEKEEKRIVDNNSPPDAPTVTCPEVVKKGQTFKIKIVTIDPDGDDVYYRVKIGGPAHDWKGSFPSGVEQDQNLNLLSPAGTYELGVQAKDVHGAESDWTFVEISVKTRGKVIESINTLLFIKFLENNPNLFTLLRQLL
jgi:hypothetical protein